ncbi:MAG: TonB-dependent receptor, partial [Bacteroidales bacterium]|nr:TonB-dependent receptor [Bacteroidales bacterium]
KDKLALRTSYNYDHTGMRANTYLPQYFIGAFQQNPTSTLYKSQTQFNNWIWDNTLTYNDQWGKHAFKAMLGLSLREERMDFIQGVAQEVLPEESYQYISLGNQESQTVSDNGSRTRGFSYFGRVSYSYDDRYMIMATVRRDGSSKYNVKWGTFPSVGLAWTISNEPWAKGHKNFDYLKLRASWGLLGNDKIAPSVGELTVTPAEAVFGGMNVIDGFINATTFSWLTWEKVNETNVGTSFGFFGNRLTGDLDWYYRLTQNAVCSARLPMQDADGTGNWATILNMGVDLNLNWEHKVNKDWTYFIGGNVSWLQNKVRSLFGTQQILKGGKTVQMVGEKMNSYYGYKVLGVYQNEEEIANDPIAVANNLKPGDFRYEDVNNDGEMNDKDKQILGSYIPDWTYGIHLGFRYRGLDLTIGLAGQAGGEMWNR